MRRRLYLPPPWSWLARPLALAATASQPGQCQRWPGAGCWDGPGKKVSHLKLFCFFATLHTYLEAIDNTLVSNQNADNVAGAAIPDEELAVVGAGHDELAVAAQEVGLLDVRRRVASSKISGSG